MAGPIIGITAGITWAGSSVAHQLAEVGGRGQKFALNLGAEKFDSTGFDTTGMVKQTKGIRGPHTGSFDILIANAAIGSAGEGATNGLVTFAAGSVLNLKRWSMAIKRAALQGTAFGATSHAFYPGLIDWGGSFDGFTDDTTALALPANGSEPATGTFKYTAAATAYTLAGSIATEGLTENSAAGALGGYSYRFFGSDALTHSAPTDGIIPAGALANDPATQLVLTASTGRTFTFATAFWTSIDTTAAVGSLVSATVGFHANGDCVIG